MILHATITANSGDASPKVSSKVISTQRSGITRETSISYSLSLLLEREEVPISSLLVDASLCIRKMDISKDCIDVDLVPVVHCVILPL
jgi:hypothetical protein